MAYLRVLAPEGETEIELRAHNTIGRHPANSVQLLDNLASKRHCSIACFDGRYVLEDLGSQNGTSVNGKNVTKQQLSDGDVIEIGTTRCSFSLLRHRDRSTTSRSSTASISEEVSQRRLKTFMRTAESFLPEGAVTEPSALRRDYERLRVSYELIRAIGPQLDVDTVLVKILDAAFNLLSAGRGAILLFRDTQSGRIVSRRAHAAAEPSIVLQPYCVRTADGTEGEVVLSSTIINEVLRDRLAVLSQDAAEDPRFVGQPSIIAQKIRATMAVPLLHRDDLLGVMVLDSQIQTGVFTEEDLQLFQHVANQAATAIQNTLLAKEVERNALARERFQRLLSPAIAEEVMSGRVKVEKGGRLRETTILFADIRGFTTLSEQKTPQDIVTMLNDYFEQMVDVVFRHGGTLDKFAGDSIMALFGAPVSYEDDAVRAVTAAFEMLIALVQFNVARQATGEAPLRIGIGINTGEVVAGYLGSSRAMQYTVIGDAVNTAARLCSVANPSQILLSEHTARRVSNEFLLDEMPAVHLKGKSQATRIFTVLGFKEPRQHPETMAPPEP